MDPLTQGLLGGVTAQLGFRRRIGRDATWMATAAAMMPDLDIFVPRLLRLFGASISDLALHRFHRGATHSLLFVPVVAAVALAIWWPLRRRWQRRHPDADRASPWLMYACCFVAALTHPLLDWCTSYGTQLFAPVTDARYAADCVAVVDIIYTPLLILTLLACLALRRKGLGRAAVRAGWVGFLLSCGYLAGGRALHDLAVAEARGMALPTRVVHANAYPVLGTIFLWRAVVETDAGWHVSRIRPIGGSDQRQTTFTPKQSNEWIDRAAAVPEAQSFGWSAMGRARPEHSTENGRHIVEFHDMRYGMVTESPESLWSLRVEFDAAGRADRIYRTRRHRRDMGKALGRLWDDIWTP